MLTPRFNFIKPIFFYHLGQASLFMFSSKMPYYRQMAQKLKIDLPLLNEQIKADSKKLCLVYGIKEVSPELFIKNQQDEKFMKDHYFDEETLIGFSLDKTSQETIEFDLVKRIAKKLHLDICLMNENNESDIQQKISEKQMEKEEKKSQLILSLTRFKEYIYREYYLKHLKTKSKRKYIETQLDNQSLIDQYDLGISLPQGATKNRIKSIRIGQDIQINDIKNKQRKINQWIQQGERSIKIISANISSKSFKSIENFCKLFNQQVEIVEQKIIVHPRKKPILRYMAILQFDHEIDIDIDFINKRWKRRINEIKLTIDGKNKKNPSQFKLSQTDPQAQKLYLTALNQSGIPYPKQYKQLTDLQEGIKKGGLSDFIKRSSEQMPKRAQSDLSGYEDQPMTQSQIKVRDRQNRRIMGISNIEDILQQMEQLKSREYEMEQYQSTRFKQLESELKDIIKRGKQRKIKG